MGDWTSKQPVCHSQDSLFTLDSGTTNLQRTSLQLPVGESGSPGAPLKGAPPVSKEVVEITLPLAGAMSWDAFHRAIYDQAAKKIQEQAFELSRKGALSPIEFEQFVAQRNALKVATRSQLSPFGELFSEILHPQSEFKTAQELLNKKGSIDAVIKGLGKTRGWVNRIGIVGRFAGPAVLVVQITFAAQVVADAPDDQKLRTGVSEAAEIGGGMAGGWYGAGSGCAAGAAATFWFFGGGAIVGCGVGGVLGGIGLGMAVGKSLRFAAEAAYDGGRAGFYWIEGN